MDNRSPAAGPFHHRYQIVFTCDVGYKLEGNSTIECINGQFNNPVPSCVQERKSKFFIPCHRFANSCCYVQET